MFYQFKQWWHLRAAKKVICAQINTRSCTVKKRVKNRMQHHWKNLDTFSRERLQEWIISGAYTKNDVRYEPEYIHDLVLAVGIRPQ